MKQCGKWKMNQRCLNSVEQIEENGENFNSHQIVFNSSNSHKNSSTPSITKWKAMKIA